MPIRRSTRRACHRGADLAPWVAPVAALLLALPAAAQDELLARNLAATCTTCHGSQGRPLGDMKPLAGMAADRLLATLADFRSGAQPATVMHQIARGYRDEQLRLIAGWFAALEPKP